MVPLLALVLAATATTAAGGAALHLALRSSEPPAEAQLDRAPTELRLTFTERVELATTRILLRAPDGSAVSLEPPRHADDEARVIVAALAAPLASPGRYLVDWRAVGRDGHPVTGTFHFDVAADAAGLAPRDPDAAVSTGAQATPAPVPTSFDSRSPLYVVVRWLGFLVLVPLIGALVYRWMILPRVDRLPELQASPPAMEERLHRWARVLAALLVVTLGLRLVAQLAAVHGSLDGVGAASLARLLATTWGQAWLLQVAGALAILAALVVSRSRAAWMVAALAAVPIVFGAGLAGHAAAAERLAPLLVSAHALHVAGVGGWIGSLLMLLLVGAPSLLHANGGRGAALSRLVAAFSPVALACAALVVTTGAGAALWHLGSVGALLASEYGRTLLVKLAVLVPVLALGAYNWRRLRPTLQDRAQPMRALSRTAGAELALALLILAVTAVLVATPPPAP